MNKNIFFLLLTIGFLFSCKNRDDDSKPLKNEEKKAVLYNEKLSSSNIPADLYVTDATYGADGLLITLPTQLIMLDKYYSLGERICSFYFKTNNSAKINFGAISDVADYSNQDNYSVNFLTKTILYFYNNGYDSLNVPFLNANNDYVAEIIKNYNEITFKVTDLKTRESAYIIRTVDGTGGFGAGNLNPNYNIISTVRDKYAMYLEQGDYLLLKQIVVTAVKKDVDLLIYGDSISEPEGYYPLADFPKSWTQLVKKDIEENGGKVLISGRGGNTISQVSERIKNELPYIKAKYVMVTIGTNGGNSEDNLTQLISYIIACGSIPILNNIPSNEANTQIATNAIIESVRQKFGIKGCKFDIPTSLNYDGQTVDTSTMYLEDYSPSQQAYHHPNPKGAKLMYLRTKMDVPEIY